MSIRTTVEADRVYKVVGQFFENDAFRIVRVRSRDGTYALVKVATEVANQVAAREILLQELAVSRVVEGSHLHRPTDWVETRDLAGLRFPDDRGRWLGDSLAAGDLSLADALWIAAELCCALEEMHRAGFVHGALAPCSVLLLLAGSEPAVRLGNLGYAERLDERQHRQRALLPEEVLRCRAPECDAAADGPPDERSDLYALGVLLRWMAQGEPPIRAGLGPTGAETRPAPLAPPERSEHPSLWRTVSGIVQRLTRTQPGDRYQSASGARADLLRCLTALREQRPLEDLRLGADDVPPRIREGGRPYGRERQLAALFSSYRRALAGGFGLTLLSGSPGAGKSTLPGEVRADLARRGGLFLCGKADPAHRLQPYRPLRDALGGVFEGAGGAAEERELARVVDSFKPQWEFVADVLPARLLPPAAARVAANPVKPEQARRFVVQLITSALRALSGPGRPVLLFIDDLQWCDAATTEVLSQLCREASLEGVLLLVAYRDEEITDNAGALHFLKTATAAVTELTRIVLEPLTLEEMAQWLADVLRSSFAKVGPLAAMTMKKTGGNPFFMQRFLKYAERSGLIWRDRATNAWEWDLGALDLLVPTDNIVDLLTAQFDRQSVPLRQILAAGAVLGSSFSDAEVAAVLELTPDQAEALLRASAQLGFTQRPRAGVNAFQHDRVREAVLRSLSGDGAAAFHLRAALALHAAARQGNSEGREFEVLLHFREGLKGDAAPAHVLAYVELAISAAPAARRAASAATALNHLVRAAELLERLPQALGAPVQARLALECQLTAYQAGDFAAAAHWYGEALAASAALGWEQIAEAHHCMINQLTMQTRYGEAMAIGTSALGALGVQLDFEAWRARLDDELDDLYVRVRGLQIDALKRGGGTADALVRSRMTLFRSLLGPAYYLDPVQAVYIGTLGAQTGFDCSALERVPYLLSVAAVGLSEIRGLYAEGTEMGLAAMALAQHLGSEVEHAEAAHVVATLLMHWTHPFPHVVQVAADAKKALERVGSLEEAGFSNFALVALFESGAPLSQVQREVEHAIEFALATGNAHFEACFLSYRQLIRALQGRTRTRVSLEDARFSEAEHLQRIASNGMARAVYCTCKLVLANHAGESELALEYAQRAEADAGFLQGLLVKGVCAVHSALAWVDSLAMGTSRALVIAKLTATLTLVRRWAEVEPTNFEHWAVWIEAELAALTGDRRRAWTCYDLAIGQTRRNAFIHDKALTLVRAAQLYRTTGLPAQAEALTVCARQAYADWGAHALSGEPGRPDRGGQGLAAQTLADVSRPLKCLLSSWADTAPARSMLELLIDLTHAQVGMLVRPVPGAGPCVLAWSDGTRFEAAADEGGCTVDEGLPQRPALALLRQCIAVGGVLVCDDAVRDVRFARDAEVRARFVRSVLVLPLRSDDRNGELVYLENNRESGAFDGLQHETLELLIAAAAALLDRSRTIEGLRAQIQRQAQDNEAGGRALDLERAARQRADAALEAARRQTERVASIRAETVASLSHEIRSPLNAVLGFVGLAEQTCAEPETRDMLRKSIRSAQTLAIVVDEILDFADLDLGRLVLEKRLFLLLDVVERMSAALIPHAHRHLCELVIDVDPALPLLLCGDARRLCRVLVSLAGNAIKQAQHGTVVVSLDALPSGGPPQEMEVRVRSIAGTQMHEGPAALLPGPTLTPMQGIGHVQADQAAAGIVLGRDVARCIVDLMGGVLTMDESEGAVQARCRLPLDVVDAGPEPAPGDGLECFHGRAAAICLRSPWARTALSRLLARFGMRALLASDPGELPSADGIPPEGVALLFIEAAGAGSASCGPRTGETWPVPGLLAVVSVGDARVQPSAASGVPAPAAAGVRDEALLHLRLELPAQYRALSRLLKSVRDGFGLDRAAAAAPGGPAAGAIPGDIANRRVLLVDDDPVCQEIARLTLERAGMRVLTANNGLQAIRALAEHDDVSVVVMDCQMPLLDGYAAARRIRLNPAWQRLPVIALTANATEADRSRVMDAGMDAHLSKPFQTDALLETIAGQLRARDLAWMQAAAAPPGALALASSADGAGR